MRKLPAFVVYNDERSKYMLNKKIVSLLLCAGMLSAALMSGCSSQVKIDGGSAAGSSAESGEPAAQTDTSSSEVKGLPLPEDGGFKTVEYKLTDRSDKYRTYYEIFPYSFCDSDGDGIGDFKGITSKLDYLNDGDPKTTDDLGIEAIWFMPIMSSPSYHKYDVIDYKSVDKAYGTVEDFEETVSEAHKRGINVIIDFVINHSSTQCEWFKKAIEELKAGKTDGYVKYYNFEKDKKDVKGWYSTGVDDWYYECEFWDQMPDLNLKNEDLRKELLDAAKFWIDKGVDGFRLDAVLWFEKRYDGTIDNDASVEELKWFYDSVKQMKDDVYMVGECWENSATIEKFYESGIDSLFDFDEQGSGGRVADSIHRSNAKKYVEAVTKWQDRITAVNPNAINTPFISNHDTGRSASFFTDDYLKKMGAAMYILSPGNAFIYYGEEIGMEGTASDPDKRKGMYWTNAEDKEYVKKIPGMTNDDVPEKSVQDMQKDDNSVLNFYKRIIALKNQNPELKSGKITGLVFDDIKEVAGFIAEKDGAKTAVIFNVSEYGMKVKIPEDSFKVSEVRGYAIAGVEKKEESSVDPDDPFAPATAADDPFATTTADADDEKPKEAVDADNFIVDGQEVTFPARSVIVLK